MLGLKIINGRVFVPGSGFFDLDVGVSDGKITALCETGGLPEAEETVDALGKIVMPGVIDPHIHLGIFNDFALECEMGIRAALPGGITTVGVFMGGDQSYLPMLPDMINTVEQKASTDLMFHLSIFTMNRWRKWTNTMKNSASLPSSSIWRE